MGKQAVVERLTKAQRSFARLMTHFDVRCVTRCEAARVGMLQDFNRCRAAGMLVSAGYEASSKAEDWWSNVDRASVATAEGVGREGRGA